MFDLKLPDINWFMHGNIYSGSFRTEPTKSCLSQTTFNYRICVIIHKDIPTLAACCWFELPWGCFSYIDEATIARFELSSFGVEVAEKWILSNLIIQEGKQLSAIKGSHKAHLTEAVAI